MKKIIVLLLILALMSFSSLSAQNIKFGILPSKRPSQLMMTYKPLAYYVSKQIGLEVKLKFYKSGDYTEVLTDLVMGDIDIAVLNAELYIKAKSRRVTGIAVATEKGAPTYHCCIVTQKNSDLKNLADLKGKKMAFVAPDAVGGYIVPTAMLKKAGVKPDDLGSHFFLGTQGRVARKVAIGGFDAGCVNENVYLKLKNYDQGLKIIARSEALPDRPLCARRGLNPDIVAKIRSALLELNLNTSSGKKILTALKSDCDGFVVVNDLLYTNFENKYLKTAQEPEEGQ